MDRSKSSSFATAQGCNQNRRRRERGGGERNSGKSRNSFEAFLIAVGRKRQQTQSGTHANTPTSPPSLSLFSRVANVRHSRFSKGWKGWKNGGWSAFDAVKKRRCAALITSRGRSNGPAEHRLPASMFFWSNWKMIPLSLERSFFPFFSLPSMIFIRVPRFVPSSSIFEAISPETCSEW